MRNSQRKAERLLRYLNFLARKNGLVNALLRIKVNSGHMGKPEFAFKEIAMDRFCPCPKFEDTVRDRVERLLKLKHGFGEVLVLFKKSKLEAIVLSLRYLRHEWLQLSWQFDDRDDNGPRRGRRA